MDTYKSDAQRINHNIGTIFQKLSNPAIFQQHIEQNKDRLPDEARANLDKVVFGPDSISIESPMGPLKLAIDPEQTKSRAASCLPPPKPPSSSIWSSNCCR